MWLDVSFAHIHSGGNYRGRNKYVNNNIKILEIFFRLEKNALTSQEMDRAHERNRQHSGAH